MIKFFEWKPQENPGFLRNLCKKPVTYQNFDTYEEKERKRCIEGGTSSEGSGAEEVTQEIVPEVKCSETMTVSTHVTRYKRIKKDVSETVRPLSRNQVIA